MKLLMQRQRNSNDRYAKTSAGDSIE